MDINNIVLLYDSSNKPQIVDLSDVMYITEQVAYTYENEVNIDVIHNCEKILQKIVDEKCTSKFLYLHDEDNTPILLNIAHILYVYTPGSTNNTATVVLSDNSELELIENTEIIYNKIKELKDNNSTEYSNIVNGQVKQSIAERSSTVTNASNTIGNSESVEKVGLPILNKLY